MRAHPLVAVCLSLVTAISALRCGRRNSYSLLTNALQPNDSNYIVGGTLARRNEFPWQVSIQINVLVTRRRKLRQHVCGGSIINERWIITAAHCILENVRKKDYSIVAGAQYALHQEATTQTRGVERIMVHPRWNERYLLNDIALIKLEQPLNLSQESVAPICLPKAGDANRFNGKTCTASGWGARVDHGETSSVLMKVDLPLVSNNVCEDRYSMVVDAQINDDMLCAGNLVRDGAGTCQGDSGGPLVCEEDGVYTLAGLTSFGVVCGSREYPAVFTRVSSFRRWIDSKIK